MLLEHRYSSPCLATAHRSTHRTGGSKFSIPEHTPHNMNDGFFNAPGSTVDSNRVCIPRQSSSGNYACHYDISRSSQSAVLWLPRSDKVFGIAVQASISGAEEDSRGSELSSKAFCISAVTASKARSMYEPGTSVAGTSVDSHRIFVNGGFQTELELSSQDQAAEPPDTAYASIMPCTAP